jgi:tetratricopeptide (TPR) repeat protein
MLRTLWCALAMAAVAAGPPAPGPAAGARLGFGEVSFPNSGSPAAQASFLRGLAQLHDFEYFLAAKSFREAEAADGGFVMAFWGEAMTHSHPVWMEEDLEAGRGALAKLGPTREARLAKAPTEREKTYLQAVEVLFGDGAKEARDAAYAGAMADLSRRFPDDPDAAAFYALALLGTCHAGRDIPVYMRAAAILEDVYRDHPNHPGVVHYLIHCYDDPVHSPLGLRLARVYGKIAPDAPHALHMTSHIFLAQGMWDETVAANEAAIGVFRRTPGDAGHHHAACGHAFTWLEYGYLEQGRAGAAKELLRACFEEARGADAYRRPDAKLGDPDDSSVAAFHYMRARYLIDTDSWTDEVAGWDLAAGDAAAARVGAAFIQGYIAVARGDREAARPAFERLRQARKELDDLLRAERRANLSSARRSEILDLELQALIQKREGDGAGAVALLRRAAAIEEQLPFAFGPPLVEKPSHELLGEVLLDLGRPAEARGAFQAALERAPRRTAALAGLARAARRSGDEAAAARAGAELRAIWHGADPAMRSAVDSR